MAEIEISENYDNSTSKNITLEWMVLEAPLMFFKFLCNL